MGSTWQHRNVLNGVAGDGILVLSSLFYESPHQNRRDFRL